MAGVCSVRFAENEERRVAIIALNATDGASDVGAILEHLEEHFVYGTVFASEEKQLQKINTGASLYEAIQ